MHSKAEGPMREERASGLFRLPGNFRRGRD
jgi:hypothetical protein